MEVTVYITTYNRLALLKRAISSVQGQALSKNTVLFLIVSPDFPLVSGITESLKKWRSKFFMISNKQAFHPSSKSKTLTIKDLVNL